MQSANGVTNEILPYTVDVATTGYIDTVTGDSGQVATYDNTAGTITSTTNGSINEISMATVDPTTGDAITQTGIDGIQSLLVGSYVLVKDQPVADVISSTSPDIQYQNGVYEVVQVGVDGSTADGGQPWILQRVSFANTAAALTGLRVAVAEGFYNNNTTYVLTNHSLTAIGASNDVIFDDTVCCLQQFSGWTGVALLMPGWPPPRLRLDAASADHQGRHSDGSSTIIDRDLGSLTDAQKKTLSTEGAAIVDDPLYTAAPVFSSLQIVIPSLSNYFTPGAVNTVFFSPTLNGAALPPNLANSVLPTDVLDLLKNGFYLGDALDLALFTIRNRRSVRQSGSEFLARRRGHVELRQLRRGFPR